jgi:pimeloyl-ACP methyl ester carboxylesterase
VWIEMDGARIFTQTGGKVFDAEKPSVVLLHGAGMDHTVWQQQSRYLAHHGWNVFAVDLPGHGLSAGQPPESVTAGADWLTRFLDAAGLKKVALIGHSLGALISLEAAGHYSEWVSKLALLGVTPKMPVHQDLLDAAMANELVAGQLIVGWGFGKQAHRGGNIAPGMWMMGGGGRLIEHARPGVLGADLNAANAYQGGLEAAGAMRCQTLLLLGAMDRMTPVKGAMALQEVIANCRTEILPGAGHMMMIESPRETLKALATFLEVDI